MYVGEGNTTSHYFLHRVNGEEHWWGLGWLLVCCVPSCTRAGLGCVSAALNPALVAKRHLSSHRRTL